MGINEIIGDKRDQILAIAAQYGAVNVRVFGSVARGDATEDSDIDFLVDFERQQSLMTLAGLHLDLEDVLGRRVDVLNAQHLRPRFAARIAGEIVLV